MAEETQKIETNETDYIAEIQSLKQSTVDKAAYEKLLEENRKLINTLATSPTREEKDEEPPSKPDLLKLGRDFLNAKSDIVKAQLSLDYRNACLELGERDPFLPTSSSYTPTDIDKEGVEAYCSTIKECIDLAKGNDKVFMSMLEASMSPDDPTISAIVANNKKRIKQF